MSVSLSPIGGAAAQFFTNTGVPLAGGKLYTYGAGGSTPVATYTTIAGNIQHSNPIVLDSTGRVPTGEIWLTDGQAYKFVLQDSANNLIGTYDNITGINGEPSTIQNFTGTGSQVNFTLSSAPKGENFTSIYINGVYQNKNTYSITGTTLTFSQAPPQTSIIEIMFN